MTTPRASLPPKDAPRRARVSLRARIVAAMLGVAVAPQLLVLGWSQLDRTVPGRMWGRVRDAMEAATRELDVGASHAELTQRATSLAEAHGVHVRLLAPDGSVVVDVDRDVARTPLEGVEAFFLRRGLKTPAERDAALGAVGARGEVAEARRFGAFVGCDALDPIVCQAAARLGPGQDAAVVHVQQSTYRPVAAVFELRGQLGRLALVTLPLGLVLALVTARALTKPLDRLRAQVARSRPGAPVAFEHDGADEIGDLTAALNGLVATLDAERKGREAFVADLVHELKSPIATLRASAEAFEEGAVDDPARRARLGRVLHDASARLDATVGRFLDLARAEAGFPNESREPVDLAELARDRVARAVADPRTKDVRFELVVDRAVVHGAPRRLDALVAELVENAASFADRGGAVRVLVAKVGDTATLQVSDDGPGIAPKDLPHVFERFYTTRGHARGSGLGLPLVRAVAEAHGGAATARSGEGGGATFTVKLPAFTRDSHAPPRRLTRAAPRRSRRARTLGT